MYYKQINMMVSSTPSSQSLEEGQLDPLMLHLSESSAIVNKLAVRAPGMDVLVKPHKDCEIVKLLYDTRKKIRIAPDEICTAVAFGATYIYRLAVSSTCRHTILQKAARSLLRARPGYVYADSNVGDVARCLYMMCIVLGHRISRRGLDDLEYPHMLSLVNKHAVRDAPMIEIEIGDALGWRLGPLLL